MIKKFTYGYIIGTAIGIILLLTKRFTKLLNKKLLKASRLAKVFEALSLPSQDILKKMICRQNMRNASSLLEACTTLTL